MEMVNELDTATDLLNSALDRYTKACFRLRNCYRQGTIPKNPPPEFLDRVLQGSAHIGAYEVEIQYPKSIASWASNLTSVIRRRSINSLPEEILARIFSLVCTLNLCPRLAKYVYLASIKQPTFIKDPVILSHVCSHWRHIAINWGNLWSHIDLIPQQFLFTRRSTRAKTYLARAGQSLLDIHI
ncbi:hypothetical protein B0J17DRAFT_682403 [Rhizoctonia solani]|nr:hypothetical protein B0J17DRAFT_682403 [Rhizoctonia solani]